jgi:hypothetical protein
MPAVASTSGRLHCELVRIIFLQAHGKPTCFFAASGCSTQTGLFRFRRAAFCSKLKSKVGNILAKATALCINLNIDDAPIA